MIKNRNLDIVHSNWKNFQQFSFSTKKHFKNSAIQSQQVYFTKL